MASAGAQIARQKVAAVPIAYFDHHATTPVDPRVLERMLPYFSEHFGNAASRSHAAGWRANEAVEQARKLVAAAIGSADPKEIVFTSGATEALQLAIFGTARMHRDRGKHLVTVATEHTAVLEQHEWLQREDFATTYVPVESNGLVDPKKFAAALTPKTVLASVMLVNNEIGVIQPIAELAAAARAQGALFLTDASQALGRIPIDVTTLGIDFMTLSAHKAYGPKGVGALWCRRSRPRAELEAVTVGGGHERGLRAGTPNVPGIVGFGEAARLASQEQAVDQARFRSWQQRLLQLTQLPDVYLNGDATARVVGNINLSFGDIAGEALLAELRDFALSAGAACSSATLEPSHVLLALGRSKELAHASLRIGLGRGNTDDQVEQLAIAIAAALQRLRNPKE